MNEINENELQEKLQAHQFLILDFSSPGCAPCKKAFQLISKIVAESESHDLVSLEIDIVKQPALAQKYFVLGVPTIIVFRKGKEIGRFNSVPKKEIILRLLK